MKNIFFFCVCGIILFSCSKAIDAPQNVPAKVQKGASKSYVEYTIFKGDQYCDKNTFLPVKIHALSFKVKFDSSAIYTTLKHENQNDINKLYGFSDNNSTHHEYSARFGWRWSDNALRLFAYDYNKGVMSFKELTTVNIGKEINCSIQVDSAAYIFSVDGTQTIMPRASTTPVAQGYKLYPYFGGDETAPHNISIWIEDLQ